MISLSTAGCLFPEPPNWDLKPTAPVLTNAFPDPAGVTNITASTTSNPTHFTFIEWSEDEGHNLRVVWLANNTFVNFRDYQPGHLNEAKPISVDYAPLQVGCVVFKISVMHVENDKLDALHSPKDETDVGTITWWLNVNDNLGTNKLSDCPTAVGG